MYEGEVFESVGFANTPWLPSTLAVDLIPECHEKEVSEGECDRDFHIEHVVVEAWRDGERAFEGP